MFELGDSLREARIRQGLSIKDVEEGTKIRSKYLQALEEEDFEVIPGPTFVKGFMRTYTDFLGLDSDRFLEEYRSRFEAHPDPHEIRPMESRSRPRRDAPRRSSNHVLVGLAALVAIIVLLWVGWGQGSEPAELDADSVLDDPTTTSTAEVAAPDSSSPGGQTATTSGSAGSLEGQSPPDVTTTTVADASAGTSDGPLELVARAEGGRCWILVRDETATGEVIFTGTLEPGQEQSFSSEGRVWMHVGSPAALELTVNGNPVEIPEPYGEFLITADGAERQS